MTFKANWEKINQQVDIEPEAITAMVFQAFPNQILLSYEIISGGCANLNIKVILANVPYLLRIYLRDPSSGSREQRIYELVKNDLPVPEILFIGAYSDENVNYHFAISQFIEGIPLRDLLLNYPENEWQEVMIEVGKLLSRLQKFTFPKAGFFDGNLEIQTPLKSDELFNFITDCLHNPEVQQVLGESRIYQLETIFKSHHTYLIHDMTPCLVHGDFDPSNILVDVNKSKWQVSAILDWEFAFAGSWLWDVANMLRYAHHMPPSFSQYFITGIHQEGLTLPKNWQTITTLFNISSLLDLLVRHSTDSRPIMIQDICALISNGIQKIQHHELF